MCRPAAETPLQVIGGKLNPKAEEFSPNYIPSSSEKAPPSPLLFSSPISSRQHIFCTYAPLALFPLSPLPPPPPPLLPADNEFSPVYLYHYNHNLHYYYPNSSYFPAYLPWQYVSQITTTSKVLLDSLCCNGPSPYGDYSERTFDSCTGGLVIIEMAPEEVENRGNDSDGKSRSPMESGVQYSVEGFPHRRRRLRSARRNVGASRTSGVGRKAFCNAIEKFEWKPKPKDTDCYPFGDNTTLMIRNIPNRLSRRELLDHLDAHCREENEKSKNYPEPTLSEFDFVYLPIDFKRNLNYGFAFVNFTTVEGASRLLNSWNHRRWVRGGHISKKMREITCAYIQGKEQLKKRLRSSVFACETDEYLPVELSPPANGKGWSRSELITIGTRGRCANTAAAAITKPPRG